ncbi:unnamed protein product [Cuscuta epithymum]|uniref:PH domain-containing protein n=1 Tax=Cuscuta epithymum TaxID=186058 RepID=A0AAV0CH24_9ASTE|nr:unnamed protein product [Cuscuta epithymum]
MKKEKEEERWLVALHELLGNHSNAATKRRQFTKRKPKEGGDLINNGNKKRHMVLENYIKYKYFTGLTLAPPSSAQQNNIDTHGAMVVITSSLRRRRYSRPARRMNTVSGHRSWPNPTTRK